MFFLETKYNLCTENAKDHFYTILINYTIKRRIHIQHTVTIIYKPHGVRAQTELENLSHPQITVTIRSCGQVKFRKGCVTSADRDMCTPQKMEGVKFL